MQLVTYATGGDVAVGVLDGAIVVPIRNVVGEAPADMIGVVEAGAALLDRIDSGLANVSDRLELSEVDLLPAIPRPPKILCLGLNYAEHAAEGGHDLPDYPSVFMRAATSLVAHGAPVLRPRVSDQLDYEAELAVVIGKRCHDTPEADALSYVFGYTLLNDVSVRDFQRKTTQWTMGKNFDATAPMGPAIVTADELPPGADGLGIRTRLNGKTVQNASTDQMVFKVPRIISLVSQVMTLEPGDVIATGTPSGVGHARKPPLWMKPGDVIEIEVDGIGTLANPVADAPGLRSAEAA